MMTRLHAHRLLRQLRWLAALPLALAAAHAGEPEGLELCLLHTNDTHARIAGTDAQGNAAYSEEGSRGGYARIATVINQRKAQGDNVLALDAGDQWQGTLFFNVNRGRMLADLDQHMPYDAVVLGNHEFDDGCAAAAEFTRLLPYPVLAANLRPTGACAMASAKTRPCVILERRGEKVGIIGLACDESVTDSAACTQTKFEDATTTLARMVAELQGQGVRHIIALTHLGLPRDRELARRVAGVDVIVGGHSHDYLGEGAEAGPYPLVEQSPAGEPVLVVTAKSGARYLGELKVRFNAAGVPASWSGAAHELGSDIVPQPELSAKVQAYARTLDEYRSVIVTTNRNDMVDGMDESRVGETLTALVVADAMLDYARAYGAEIALVNAGGIRAALPQGAVSRGDVMTVLPFSEYFPVLVMSGEQIVAALEHGVAGELGQGPELLHAAGLSYLVDAARPAGSRVSEVTVAGAPIEPARKYRVAMPAYIAGGGDGFSMMPDCRTIKTPMKDDAKVLEDYLRRHNTLPRPQTGRLRRR